MVVESKLLLVSRFQSFSRAASTTVILIGGLVLVGWLADVTILKSLLPGYVTMRANTAVAFILAGLSLWRLKEEPLDPTSRRFAQTTGVAVFLIGLLTLTEYLFGWDLGIDQLLFTDPIGPVRTPFPGRMAPTTALNFVMAGSALFMLSRGVGLWGAQGLTLMAALISLLALIGYAYGVESLYRVGHYTAMALHTSTAFVVLSAGILCVRPDRGVMATFASDHAGGILMRRLFPSVIGMLLAAGWIRLEGQRAGFYDTEMGLSLMVISAIVILSGLIWRSAWVLNRETVERERAEAGRHAAEARFAGIVESAVEAVISVDETQRIVLFNKGAEDIFGYRAEEVLGRPLNLLLPTRVADAHRDHIRNFAAAPETARRMGERREIAGRRKDGTEFPAEASISKLRRDGQTLYTVILRDITERKQAEEELRRHRDHLQHLVKERTAELESTNQELEAFSYSVSHDLRAPLRHIGGFVELLQEHPGAQFDAKGRHYMNTIMNSTKRMGSLIDDLLVFSRMAKSEMRIGRVNLDQLAREVIKDLQPEIQGREIVWEIGHLPEVYGDATMLRQVWVNLIGNAVKYTRPRTRTEIEIGARSGGEEDVFFVRDNGVGFDPQYTGKLFGVFQRLHSSDEFEGTGIGLANVRRIIHRHGGRTWAEGCLDRGAVFYFSLPKGGGEPQ